MLSRNLKYLDSAKKELHLDESVSRNKLYIHVYLKYARVCVSDIEQTCFGPILLSY